MIEFDGKIEGIQRDIFTDSFKVIISTNQNLENVDIPNDILTFKAGRKHKKRSLDSNAYAWVLMQKIAEVTHTDRWSVYLEMLKRYSGAFTFVVCQEQAVGRMKELYRAAIEHSRVTINGKTGVQLQVFYGSSTFNTKEMSVFIDGIVYEAKSLGISTLTPRELNLMKGAWGR